VSTSPPALQIPSTGKIEKFVTAFDQLGLCDSLHRAIEAAGYETATPIQLQAIPAVISGRDLMGCAQTGTGKTAAFALPTLNRLATSASPAQAAGPAPKQKHNGRNGRRDSFPRGDRRPIRSLILAPTRELAAQIGQSFKTYGRFTGMRYTCIYGGVGQGNQVRDLQNGVDVLVATPGRLLDLMDQGHVNLRNVEILILDEADQMLDMGFIVPLRKIVASVPKTRQTLMFSATMPPEIRKLASEWLSDPINIHIAPVAKTTDLVEQSVYFVDQRHKPHLLTHFLQNNAFTRAIVFARTKHGADKIVKHLDRAGIRAAAIHGNKSQNVRQRTLADFKSNRPPVLVATDIAARGLDVNGISHVINYELPETAEIYVHRIGRTGRAGATGIATSFCSHDERGQLRQIERLTRKAITVEQSQPEYPKPSAPAHGDQSHNHGRHSGPPKTGASRRPRNGAANGAGKPRRPKQRGELATAGAGAGGGSGRPAQRRRRRPAGRRTSL
jgi:ATP-dependent RNA helicase RhlE